ncbi:hypothetical protein O181_026476 [Austropuccinia psidii MF-1]|uniref:Uncharacterized protein n=1 Tax=Austropuccinia psidii MF-1 TaxID=1389203 RepID=A0A9Q3H0J2_9BASI|nr:hypothetical protein [Austropuccinia psidii MF-1]
MTSIGTIIKEINISHRKGNIRLNPESVVLEDAPIQGFLLGADHQRMYFIDIYNSQKRDINVGMNKEKKFSHDIYQFSNQETLEDIINSFKEGKLSAKLTSKQKLNSLTTSWKTSPSFRIGDELLGKIRGHNIELYLYVERPYPPLLRRLLYP